MEEEQVDHVVEENRTSYYPTIKQSWGIAGISILLMVLVGIAHVFIREIVGDEASFFVYYVLAMGGTIWFAHRKRNELTGSSVYNFDFNSTESTLIIPVAAMAVQVGIVWPLTDLIPMPEFWKEIFLRMGKSHGIFSFLTIVIAAPVLEELIFIGIILDGLLKQHSPSKAIMISSVMFGVVHMNPWQFIAAFVVGNFSGWVYYRTKTLGPSILIHLTVNFVAFCSMYFMNEDMLMSDSLVNLYGGYMNLFLITAGAIVAGGISLYFLNLNFKNPESELADNQHSDRAGD